MKTGWIRNLVIPVALFFPSLVFGVVLDPGGVGDHFTFTAVGTVDSLDNNAFGIEFSDDKYLTITPYETDARFVFGIDFNSTGLDSAAISGFLTDSLGNEIAGTSFTGVAISSGFGGGLIELNEVVVAYGAHISFTAEAPVPPFQVRLGAGVLSNVFEDRPVIGQGSPPEPVAVDIPAVDPIKPIVDGILSWGEWSAAARLDLDNGYMAFFHDQDRLYILINMLSDDGDDSFASGGGDFFWLYFDVDRNGVLTPGVDLRYRLESATGNLRYQTVCEDCLFGFNPLEAQSFSSRAEGFGCYLEDGSAEFFPLSCNSHRIWELAIDLHEIGVIKATDFKMGYLLASGEPFLSENFPANLNDPAAYTEFHLSFPSRDTSGIGAGAWNPNFEVTQAVQTSSNDLDLVADKPTAVRVWSDTEATFSKNFVYGARSGIDLPGSPLMYFGIIGDASNTPDARNRGFIYTPPISWAESGTTDFEYVLQRLNDSVAARREASILFAPTRSPVFWTVPVTFFNSAMTEINVSDATVTAMEQSLLSMTPLLSADFVRRPTLDITGTVTSESLKEELVLYDQQMILAWTLGLLIQGESPFDIPQQITAFTGSSLPKAGGGSAGGSSDPIWVSGEGRVAWIGSNAVNGLLGYAHELNHNLDMRSAANATWGYHIGGCTADASDTAWPHGTSNAIQETGVLWNGMRFFSVVDTTPDFMSYCTGSFPVQWISAYRWNAWLDLFRTDMSAPAALTASAASTAGAAVSPEDSFYLMARVYPNGQGEIGQVLSQPGFPASDGTTGDHAIVVLDCGNNAIGDYAFKPSFVNAEGNPVEYWSTSLILPAPADACAIELRHGDQVLDNRQISPNAPVVNLLSPNGGELWEGEVTVSWTASDADDDALLFSLLYSADDGMTWQALKSRISSNQQVLDSSQIPASEYARIRILATDGANTAEDDSDSPFTVIDKPPSVSILSPIDGMVIPAGIPITLNGLARDTLGERLPDSQLLWSVDGQAIGMGASQQAFLGQGEHEVVLAYLEDEVAVASATAMITINDGSDLEDPIDDLPSGVDIRRVSLSVEGDRLQCQIVVASGDQGVAHKSQYTCYIDFDNLEDEQQNACDANADGVLEGGYRLGGNGFCSVEDIGLNYRPGRNGGECTGLPGVLCSTTEFAGGMTDPNCDGEVAGQAGETCLIIISAPLADIAVERDRLCAGVDDGCLGGVDPGTGLYQAYANFRAKLKKNQDRAPDTDENESPNSTDEVLRIQLRR
jgi:hypothetical protein